MCLQVFVLYTSTQYKYGAISYTNMALFPIQIWRYFLHKYGAISYTNMALFPIQIWCYFLHKYGALSYTNMALFLYIHGAISCTNMALFPIQMWRYFLYKYGAISYTNMALFPIYARIPMQYCPNIRDQVSIWLYPVPTLIQAGIVGFSTLQSKVRHPR